MVKFAFTKAGNMVRADYTKEKSIGGYWVRASEVEQLEQERNQLAARVERLEAEVFTAYVEATDRNTGRDIDDWMDDVELMFNRWKRGRPALNESPTASLAAHDKALLLRLADEYVVEVLSPAGEHFQMRFGDWLIAKAEEMK